MKTIKILVAIITFILMTSCIFGTAEKEENFEEYGYENEVEFYNEDSMNQDHIDIKNLNRHNITGSKSNNGGLKNFQIHDIKTGLVSSTIPFPASWRRITNNTEYLFEGPNNLKVSGSFGNNFTYGNQYGGNNNVPPMNIQQIINKFFMPYAKQTNRKLIKSYELPDVARTTKIYLSQLWKSAPLRTSLNSYGIEWVDDKNMKYITIVNVTINESQYGNHWGFFGQYLQASSKDFEKAKNAFIYGTVNTEFNPQQIAAFNQNEMQRASASNAAHQSRMAALNNQAAAQHKLGQTYSDISDINHNGYMKRSGMNDAGHSKSVDAVYGNTTVFNPNQSWQTYKVESYDNYYYGNGQGEVFSTDNSLYNPNLDNTVNEQDWTRYEIDN